MAPRNSVVKDLGTTLSALAQLLTTKQTHQAPQDTPRGLMAWLELTVNEWLAAKEASTAPTGVALATLLRWDVAEHLLDVLTAASPSRTLALRTGHCSTHTQQGITPLRMPDTSSARIFNASRRLEQAARALALAHTRPQRTH